MLKLKANALRRAIVMLNCFCNFDEEMRDVMQRLTSYFSAALQVTRKIHTNMLDESSLKYRVDRLDVSTISTGIISKCDILTLCLITSLMNEAKHFLPLAGGPVIATIHGLHEFEAFMLRM